MAKNNKKPSKEELSTTAQVSAQTKDPKPTPFDKNKFVDSYPEHQRSNGKIVPDPEEYDEVSFGIAEIMKYFFAIYFLLFLPILAIQ